MSEITVNKAYTTVRGKEVVVYQCQYIDGGWHTTDITQSEYYYFKKLSPQGQYRLFEKWWAKKKWY